MTELLDCQIVGVVDTRNALRWLAEAYLDGEEWSSQAELARQIRVFAPTLADLDDEETVRYFVERLCHDVDLFRRWHMGSATWEEVLGADAQGSDRDGQAEQAVAERVEDTLRTLVGVA